ncbi:hypothetical protein MPH_05475 [Macrophomina phaseolina MS6]|uniref:Uncharacterized protein n=1 Tax=Macrophomina phaseolina (strain MS6) TaxID=1126212 RepID=K2SKD2_MACPH|nr:hypothetical protein MPH_05475 [Macrophomina phaseolina MS6]
MPHIILLGTCDTKLEELLFTREKILKHKDTDVTLIDVGRTAVSDSAITVTTTELTSQYAPESAPSNIGSLDRGELNKHMAACATNYIRSSLKNQQNQSSDSETQSSNKPFTGIISMGGSGGTSLAAAVMREALPMGFPKLIVSTIASGETGPIVGETDITLMYSIVDIAGLNNILRIVLSNAAGAIVGMANAYHQTIHDRPNPSAEPLHPQEQQQQDRKGQKTPIRLGITMFGVTTPAVTAIRAYLASLSALPASQCPYAFPDTHIFHATGHGGLAFERLLRARALDAAIDLTTTELADYLVAGANMSAGPTRLTAAPSLSIPSIVSLGATDMANFGPISSVPETYAKSGRRLYQHNPSVTLMRTSVEECRKIGELVVEKLKGWEGDRGRCQVWIPKGGVSAMSVAGGPFEDREADDALFGAVREGLKGSGVEVVEDERDINDEGFARALVDALVGILRKR